MAEKDPLDFSLEELQAFLAGEDYVEPEPTPDPETAQEPGRSMPQTVEVDGPIEFTDLIRGRGTALTGGRQIDYQQAPAVNSFERFLADHYREQAQRIKALANL